MVILNRFFCWPLTSDLVNLKFYHYHMKHTYRCLARTIIMVFITIPLVNAQNNSGLNSKWLKIIEPTVKSQTPFDVFRLSDDVNSFDQQLKKQLTTITLLMDSGRYQEAISKTNHFLHELPESGYPHFLRGICYMETWNLDSAIYDFYQVLKTKDFYLYGEVHMKLGTIALQGYQAQKAIDEFQLSKKFLPNSPMPPYLTGLALLQRGQSKYARVSLDEATSKDRSFFPAYLVRVLIDLDNNDIKSARKETAKLLEIDANNYQGNLLSGVLCLNDNKGNCESFFYKAIELAPEEPTAYGMLSRYFLDKNEYTKALRNWKLSIDRGERIPMGIFPKTDFQRLLNSCIILLNDRLDSYSLSERANIGKALLAHLDKKFVKAEKHISKVLKDNKNDGALLWLKAVNYDASINDNRQALKNYKDIEDIFPNNADLLGRIGLLYGEIKDNSNCANYLKQAVNLDSANFNMIKNLGNASFKDENYQQAVQAYSTYLNHSRLDNNILTNRSRAYIKLGEIDSAIEDLNEVLLNAPDNVKATKLILDCYKLNDDMTGALGVMDRYIDFLERYIRAYGHQKVLNAHHGKAELYASYEKWELAAKEFENCLSYDEDNLLFRVNKGVMLYRAEQYLKAKKEFDIILNKEPQEANSQYYKGMCLIKLGEEAKGLELVRLAKDNGYQEAIAYLEKYEGSDPE